MEEDYAEFPGLSSDLPPWAIGVVVSKLVQAEIDEREARLPATPNPEDTAQVKARTEIYILKENRGLIEEDIVFDFVTLENMRKKAMAMERKTRAKRGDVARNMREPLWAFDEKETLPECVVRAENEMAANRNLKEAAARTIVHWTMLASPKYRSQVFGKSLDRKAWRNKVKEYYGAEPSPDDDKHRKKVWCHDEGDFIEVWRVIAAHIVPRSMVSVDLSQWFGSTEDLGRDPKNGLCLSSLTEEAYDYGTVVIIPSPRQRGEYVIEVVDRKALREFAGCEPRPIRGKPLTFRNENRPSPRYLFFRYIMTACHHHLRGTFGGFEDLLSRYGNDVWAPAAGPWLRKSGLRALVHQMFGKNRLIAESLWDAPTALKVPQGGAGVALKSTGAKQAAFASSSAENGVALQLQWKMSEMAERMKYSEEEWCDLRLDYREENDEVELDWDEATRGWPSDGFLEERLMESEIRKLRESKDQESPKSCQSSHPEMNVGSTNVTRQFHTDCRIVFRPCLAPQKPDNKRLATRRAFFYSMGQKPSSQYAFNGLSRTLHSTLRLFRR